MGGGGKFSEGFSIKGLPPVAPLGGKELSVLGEKSQANPWQTGAQWAEPVTGSKKPFALESLKAVVAPPNLRTPPLPSPPLTATGGGTHRAPEPLEAAAGGAARLAAGTAPLPGKYGGGGSGRSSLAHLRGPKPPSARAPARDPAARDASREGAAGLTNASRLAVCAVEITATAEGVHTTLQVELESGDVQKALPGAVEAGMGAARGMYISTSGPVVGALRVGRGPAVSIVMQDTVLARRDRHRKEKLVNHVAVNGGLDKKQTAVAVCCKTHVAADVTIGEGWQAVVTVRCRAATDAEVRRQAATQDLLEAMDGTKYSSLHAQIVKARARGVEAAVLDRAAAVLKTLQAVGPSEKQLTKCLKWSKVTVPPEGREGPVQNFCPLEGCPVADPIPGQHMEIEEDAVSKALSKLKGMVTGDAGRWLFEKLAAACVVASPEGGVWRSGRHVIFTNPSRNQSHVAFTNYLFRIGHTECAAAISALVQHTEAKYGKRVTAAQVNLHLDASTCHKQHRDIYGIEQRDRAGRDCTCSFKPNVATACYSIGSSRRILVKSETDSFSAKRKCCEECEGHSEKLWLNNGDCMYFNDVWNKSHTHGIPPHETEEDGKCGARLSIALLCAEGDNENDPMTCPLDILKGASEKAKRNKEKKKKKERKSKKADADEDADEDPEEGATIHLPKIDLTPHKEGKSTGATDEEEVSSSHKKEAEDRQQHEMRRLYKEIEGEVEAEQERVRGKKKKKKKNGVGGDEVAMYKTETGYVAVPVEDDDTESLDVQLDDDDRSDG